MTGAAAGQRLREFLALSVALTGFSEFELNATGMARTYLEVAREAAGGGAVEDLLDRFHRIQATGAAGDDLDRALRDGILSLPRPGALARTLVKLWYLGQWESLPDEPVLQAAVHRHLYHGRQMHHARAMQLVAAALATAPQGGAAGSPAGSQGNGNTTRVISGEAYLQGLAWPAMGTHPMGGKQQGYGAWADPPPGTGPVGEGRPAT